MGVPIESWVETMKKHPAKWRFQGLSPSRSFYRPVDNFFEDVREACVADADFMDNYMEQEVKGTLEALKEELANVPDRVLPPDHDDHHVEDYAMFLRSERWNEWQEPENINLAPARKVIEKLELKDGEHTTVHGWGRCDREGMRYAWACKKNDDPSWAWDCIRQDEPEYYLKEHPPVEMWSHAYERGVPLEEILLVCPGCGREPVRESDITRDPLKFYCGLCGAEAAPDEGETLEGWAEAVGVKLWPFKEEKAA